MSDDPGGLPGRVGPLPGRGGQMPSIPAFRGATVSRTPTHQELLMKLAPRVTAASAALVLVGCGAVLGAVPATAAAPAADYTAPYASSSAPQVTSCQAGSACSAAAV